MDRINNAPFVKYLDIRRRHAENGKKRKTAIVTFAKNRDTPGRIATGEKIKINTVPFVTRLDTYWMSAGRGIRLGIAPFVKNLGIRGINAETGLQGRTINQQATMRANYL